MLTKKSPLPDLPKYEVIASKTFRKNWDEVFEFIDREWRENSVENFNFELKRRLENLQYLPNNNPKYRIRDMFRFFPIWGYIVLFFVDEKKKIVVVDHIYHASRNIEELLKKEDK